MSNNKTSYPFYIHPMGHKRSIQIIKEAKAEIKKMELHRPSTPFGRKKTEKEHCLLATSRPSSSSSLKSFKYEHEEECCLPARKLHPLNISKGKEIESRDLKLEPLVTRSVLSTRKNLNTAVKIQNQTDIIFPPITYGEKGKDVKATSSSVKEGVSLLTLENNFPLDSHNNIISSDSNSVDQEICKPNFVSILSPEESEKLENEDTDTEELSQELKHILFVLDKNIKLGKRKCEEDQIAIVCKLFAVLKEKNAMQSIHCHRIPLLKLLFKLLDSNLPALSLHTIKLLLEMKVKDKNLGSIFRLVLRLINNHPINLEEYDLYETLIEAIQEVSLQSNKEAAMYGIVVLKSLIFKNKVEREHLVRCATLFLHHLRQFNDMSPSPEHRCDDTYIDLNKQIFVTLNYLAEEADVWEMLANVNNLSEILKGLNFFYQNSDVIQIIVRLISKIIDQEDGCYALAQCPENLVMILCLILQTHKFNIDITLQTTFIIGNLILIDKKVAQAFLNLHNLHDILIKILEEYVKEHIQLKRTISDVFKLGQGDTNEDRNWRHDVFEVISRILCIFANICLSTEAGYCLAQENSIVLHLLNIIGAYLKQETLYDTNLPIYSFLVVIGNISYYLSPESETSLKIAKRVVPLLDDSFSLEVRREAANIVQNLTRSPEVRKYIQEFSLLPAFLKLLSENDKEFNDAAYGIVMNLLLDRSNHHIFYKEKGIERILHKLKMSTHRDWKTSSMLCQILWNYCKCLNDDAIPISKIEAQHLIKYLSYSTSQNENLADENSESYCSWKNDFCPVAKKLLILLQSKNCSVT